METACSHMFNVRLELQSRLDCMLYFVHCTGNEYCHMFFCSTAPIPLSFDLFYPQNLNPSITYKISRYDCIQINEFLRLSFCCLSCYTAVSTLPPNGSVMIGSDSLLVIKSLGVITKSIWN